LLCYGCEGQELTFVRRLLDGQSSEAAPAGAGRACARSGWQRAARRRRRLLRSQTVCQSASTQQSLGQLSRDCTGAHHGLGRPRCKQPQLPQPPGQQVRHLQLLSPPHPSGIPWWCKWPFLLPFSRLTRSPIPALSSSQRRRRPGRPATVLGADSRSHGCVPCHAVL